MTAYTIENLVQDIDALLFLRNDFETEYDRECRDYIVSSYLDVASERDPKTGNRYWLEDAPGVGEIIDRILEYPDAPAGIAEWYEEH